MSICSPVRTKKKELSWPESGVFCLIDPTTILRKIERLNYLVIKLFWVG